MKGYNTSKYEELLNKFTTENLDGICLHLGSGPKHILKGWTNCDKYCDSDPRIVPWDMADLPQEDYTVSKIYSSHSLEHLPLRQQIPALHRWIDLLKTGGELLLAVPDFKKISKILMDDGIPMADKLFWFEYTLHGYQITPESYPPKGGWDQYTEVDFDEGQVHYGSWWEDKIRFVLSGKPCEIIELFEYDGWGTPSICLHLRKE